nr:hypothetical protein [Tanacetum cinerariifolium]
MRALTLVSPSSNDTSNSSQSCGSGMRPLFLFENKLGAEVCFQMKGVVLVRKVTDMNEMKSLTSSLLQNDLSFHTCGIPFDDVRICFDTVKSEEQRRLAIEEKQELLAEEQAANPSEPSPVSYFYNADYDNISTQSTAYTIHLTKSDTIITNSSEPTRRIYHNHDIFYDGDDDEELFPDEVKRIRQILEKTSFNAITPNFTNSLSMGDEHLSTIPETESDELIKSSVENLVPNPCEFEDLSDIESECNVPVCDDFTTVSNPLFDVDDDFSSSDDESFSDEDVPKEIYSNPLFDEEIISIKIDPHHFNVESDLVESLLNQDSSIISSSKIDSLLEEFSSELAHIDLISPGINEADFDPEEEIRLVEKLFDSFMEDIDIFLSSDDSIPPVIDTLLPFSSKNEDKVFNLGILASKEKKLPHLLSHRGFKAIKLNFDISESPMMIYDNGLWRLADWKCDYFSGVLYGRTRAQLIFCRAVL